jgi:Zn-dependent peptidase ImmA (M78 family)/predicted secreted protein
MVTNGDATRVQSAAAMEATRLHRELGTSYEAPVDVLGIARDLGLVLMMQPLDNLLGFYVRGDLASGIVINSRVPESLQRFTLAHEIGHHVLGHQGTADDEHAMGRFDPSNLLEVAAQSFAGSLLMPLPLQMQAIRDLPARRAGRPLQATDAYLFSRQLGVSYEAGTWTLYRRGFINLASAREFVKAGALRAKNQLRGSDPLDSARADVWMLGEENNDLSVMCRVGDEIHVQLPEDTSAGVAWLLRSPETMGLFDHTPKSDQLEWSNDDVVVAANSLRPTPNFSIDDPAVELAKDEHLAQAGFDFSDGTDHSKQLQLERLRSASDDFVVGGGTRELTFIPRREGDAKVRLELRRAWEDESPAISTYELDLRVRSRQLAGHGLFAPTPETWVDEYVETA